MSLGVKVLEKLRPEGGWVISENDYDSILFLDCEPVSKEEFEATLKEAPKWIKAEEDAKATARQALLNKLGITEEEARLLLGGN